MDCNFKIVSSVAAGLTLSFKVCATEQNATRKAMSRLNQGLTKQLPRYREEREAPAHLPGALVPKAPQGIQ